MTASFLFFIWMNAPTAKNLKPYEFVVVRDKNTLEKLSKLKKKFHQQISSIKKPFLIVLHSLDDADEKNKIAIAKFLKDEELPKLRECMTVNMSEEMEKLSFEKSNPYASAVNGVEGNVGPKINATIEQLRNPVGN